MHKAEPWLMELTQALKHVVPKVVWNQKGVVVCHLQTLRHFNIFLTLLITTLFDSTSTALHWRSGERSIHLLMH